MISRYKIIAGLLAFIFTGVYIYTIPDHYREQGRQEVKAEYEKLSQTALNARLLENAKLAFEYQSKSREIVREYENQLNKQKSDYDNRIANDKRDGLRFKTACVATTRKTDSETPKGNNAEIEYRLPQGIENGIYEVIGKCNATQDRLNLIIDKANALNLVH